MKRYCSILSLLLVLGFISCGGDDEKPAFEFKDQNAVGKMNDDDFVYADGYADDTDQPLMRITLTEAQSFDLCDGMPEGHTIFFYVESIEKLTKLNDENTITFVEEDEQGSVNRIASTGAVEIVEITDTHVSGRIDARVESHTRINGNFSVSTCAQ